MAMPSLGQRIDDLARRRQSVLQGDWCRALSPAETREHLASLAPERFAAVVYALPHARPYIQPRGGFGRFEQQLALTEALDRAGADFLPLTIDSYTRNNDHEHAALLLQRSTREAKDYLNGYPLLQHGHQRTRELWRGRAKPVSLRHGTPDARALVEAALAAGITEIEGGAITYCLPYSAAFPLDRSLSCWQYVDRVCAEHSTASRAIHRESFGPLTATMVPPAVTVAIECVELLLAAEQGVRSFALGFSQTGSVAQDLALARVLRERARVWLDRCGFDQVDTRLVYHQWMGPFPVEPERANALIALSTMVAALARPDKIVTKTKDEALGIPSIEANRAAVELVRFLLDHASAVELAPGEAILAEAELIAAEADAIVAAVLEAPGSDLVQSVLAACQRGYLDVPFAPHKSNPHRLRTARDRGKAIRITDPGAVPIGDALLAREREMLGDAEKRAGDAVARALADINLML